MTNDDKIRRVMAQGRSAHINFCPDCGAPMTHEAVDILWKRLEAMQDEAETV